MKDKEPTMAKYLDRLTWLEQQIICNQVRSFSDEQRYAHLHPGLLPFTPLSIVKVSLTRSKVARPIAVILSKLQMKESAFTQYSDKLLLRTAKVFRVFGPDPAKGRCISWLEGRPVVALRLQNKADKYNTRWAVDVKPEHRLAILYWLADQCGP